MIGRELVDLGPQRLPFVVVVERLAVHAFHRADLGVVAAVDLLPPPNTDAIASIVVRMTLLYWPCSVSDALNVWQMETGIPKVVDPWAGSYFMESLTRRSRRSRGARYDSMSSSMSSDSRGWCARSARAVPRSVGGRELQRGLSDHTAAHQPLTLELASSDTPSMELHIMTRTLRPATRNTIAGALILACCSASCAATTKPNSSVTKMVTSWKDPTATISSSQTKKILFVALVKDEAYSSMMETQLVEMSNGKGIAAHTFIKGGSTTERDKAAFEQKIRSDGIDLVLIMRLKETKEEPRYVPGTQTYGGYPGYWGYYNYVAPMYASSGFYTSDKHFLVETNVYSVSQSKLLWSGVTDNVNPSYRTTTTIGKAVIESMKKEGFLVE